MTEDQKDRVTDTFVALLDAAKAVIAHGDRKDWTAHRLLATLATAVDEVEITCAAIELENAGLVEERITP